MLRYQLMISFYGWERLSKRGKVPEGDHMNYPPPLTLEKHLLYYPMFDPDLHPPRANSCYPLTVNYTIAGLRQV